MEATTKRKRLGAQGLGCLSDQEMRELTFGNRFTYGTCAILAIIGVATANIPLLAFLMVIAYLGGILPNHPFDYIYNYVLRHWMKKPKLPESSNQKRFACGLAAPWLAGTIYLFYLGHNLAGYLLGGGLVLSAVLVSTTDICIPSMVYNLFYRKKPA